MARASTSRYWLLEFFSKDRRVYTQVLLDRSDERCAFLDQPLRLYIASADQNIELESVVLTENHTCFNKMLVAEHHMPGVPKRLVAAADSTLDEPCR